jgi:predicted permease
MTTAEPRPASRMRFLEILGQDLRYGLRMMRRSPGFTIVALLSLGFGIGTNTAIFSIVDTLLLQSLPVANADRLVILRRRAANGASDERSGSLFSYRMYCQIAQSPEVCQGVIALTNDFTTVVRAKGSPRVTAMTETESQETAKAQLVSGNFFSTLGVLPAAGRFFNADEDVPPVGHPVAVISSGYWRRRFAADRAVVGSTIEVNGYPVTVVGVLPSRFNGVFVDLQPDVYLPLTLREAVHYSGNSQTVGLELPVPIWQQPLTQWLVLMARRQPGVSLEQASATLDVLLHRELHDAVSGLEDPADRRDLLSQKLILEPGARGLSQLRQRLTQPLFILLALAVLVLLIACANVANLLLARADRRRKEMAVRLGIGAARGRLLRQLLTESLLLAGFGGLLGLVFGFWGSRFLYTLVARPEVPIQLADALDLRKLAAAAGIAMFTGLVFGLAPALLTSRVDLSTVLKDASRSVAGSGGRPGSRLSPGRLLVAAQIALSLVLLVGAGLFIRSLRNLSEVDPGFARGGLLMVEMNPRILNRTNPQLLALYRNLVEHTSGLPGVRSATVSLSGLFRGHIRSSDLAVPGVDARKMARPEDIYTDVSLVGANYFETVGVPILRGRSLTDRDRENSAAVAVVNESLARRFFPNGDAVGRHIGFGDDKNANAFEIVGIAKDTKYNTLREDTPLMVYRPVFQDPDVLSYLLVRTDPHATNTVAARIRSAVAEIEPQLPIFEVIAMDTLLDRSVARERAVARLSAFFGGLALLLAAIGLYGVMSYAVVRRTNEIGVRMALGARPGSVLQLVFLESLWVTAIGALAGLIAASVLSQFAASQLFGLKAHDPATLVGATLLLTALALVAGYLPARRAAATDPMTALRHE